MTEFRSILVPLDGSPFAEPARAFAEVIGRAERDYLNGLAKRRTACETARCTIPGAAGLVCIG